MAHDKASVDKAAVRKVLDKAKAEKRDSLTAPEGKLVCDAYGIAVPKEGVARSAQEAGKLANGMGFPVVLKIVSPDILHKTKAAGGVGGAEPVSRHALADLIKNVWELTSEFPELEEMDLNPVFASKSGAVAADVRIVVDWNPPPQRYRPGQQEIVGQMNRIMRPDSVAVIGASAEDGKIGNSVMKNLINGGYQGKIHPIHPKADEIMGRKAYKSVKDVPGNGAAAVFPIPAKFVAQALPECGAKKIPGAGLIPSGCGETRNVEG